MTAEEIRNTPLNTKAETVALEYWLQEIAAQLADQNQQLREDRELRQIIVTEQRSEAKKRDELLATASAGIERFRKNLETPPQLIPVFRPPMPGAMPEHLGCFVLMPDGSYGVAIEGGIVPLEPEEAQRIVALLSKPSEGKPQ